MFMSGAMAYKYPKIIEKIMKIPLSLLFLVYLISYYILKDYAWGNTFVPDPEANVLSYTILITMVVKIAFTMPTLSEKLLIRNDFSYGIYIFHMPIVNYLLFEGYGGTVGFLIALLTTAILSAISWFFVERPCLRRKKNQLRKI